MARSTNSSNASVRGNINEQPTRRILGAGGMIRDEGDLSPNEFVNFYKKYYANEDKNYHSENVVLSAKLFGTPEQLAQAKAIQTRHDVIGYLTPETAKERDALVKKLAVSMAKQILTMSKNDPEGYDRVLRASKGDYGTKGNSARSEIKEMPDYNLPKQGDMSSKEMDKFFAKYAKNENSNNHTENVILMAKKLGTPEDLKEANRIKREQSKAGELTEELSVRRNALDKKLSKILSEQVERNHNLTFLNAMNT